MYHQSVSHFSAVPLVCNCASQWQVSAIKLRASVIATPPPPIPFLCLTMSSETMTEMLGESSSHTSQCCFTLLKDAGYVTGIVVFAVFLFIIFVMDVVLVSREGSCYTYNKRAMFTGTSITKSSTPPIPYDISKVRR